MSFKTKLLKSILILCSTNLFAGPMGAVKESTNNLIPFVSGEALYAWPDINGFTAQIHQVGDVSSTMSNNGWGGRGAAGIMSHFNSNVLISGEMGWGYYGHVTLDPTITPNAGVVLANPANSIFNINMDSYAFDMLAGFYYNYSNYDFFFKAGAFFENLRTKVNLHPGATLTASGSPIATIISEANVSVDRNLEQILPVIKLGGDYHLTNNLILTASWMHAFGGDLGFTANRLNLAAGQLNLGSLTLNSNNPTLNVVLFGLEYRFV